jgi:small conductance mechanosensitive channel
VIGETILSAVNGTATTEPGPVEDLLEGSIPYADTVAAVVMFVVAFAVVYLVGRTVVGSVFSRLADARGLEAHARKPLRKVLNGGVIFVAISVAFGAAGLGSFLRALATIAAAATLAIGFALQDVIKNFVSGVFIFTDKPFRIGDWIEWDGNSGVVEDISMRVTRVRTFDNELLTVPNAALTTGVVKNPVAKGRLRLKFVFGISYDDDIDRAADIIVEAAENHGEILDDPAPTVRLTELGDSYVGLQSRIWIDDPSRADFVKIRGEYVKTVKQRFDEEGIDIPFPNRTLGGSLELDDAEALAQAVDD